MPKSKQRKKHKNRLNNFKNKREQKINRTVKLQNMFMEQIRTNQEHAKREHIIETILNSKPELAKEVETKSEDGNVIKTYEVNTDVLEVLNDSLVWK